VNSFAVVWSSGGFFTVIVASPTLHMVMTAKEKPSPGGSLSFWKGLG